MKKTLGILFLILLVACNSGTNNLKKHQLESKGDTLLISYTGEGDVVQFKMFEGLNKILDKNDSGVFEGQLEIENLQEAIFSYELIVHKKDNLDKMIRIENKPESEEEIHFLWVGNKRDINYKKAKNISGELITKTIHSSYLNEERALTIYTPKDFNDKTPIIYFTDGSVVNEYAPYVDKLISEEIIKPVKLIGVHSSQLNRYKEYVNNGLENDLFAKHEDFFYKEVLNNLESEFPNWNGERFLYGFSNGGAFCMYAGINHPELFKEIIAFSTADYITEFLKPITFNKVNYPTFYMGAGRYEKNIFKSNIKFIPKLKAENIPVEFKEFISGHDYNVWKIEFLLYLKKRFKK